jgi:hypothetical protein
MWAAPELLGAPTIGGGGARSGGGGGALEVKLASKPPEIYEKGKKRAVSHTFCLINHPKRRFLLKSTLQDILTRCFLRNT